MTIRNTIRHEFIARLEGVLEGILQMADKTTLKVQKTKVGLEIRHLENELRNNYSRLGELAFQLKSLQGIGAINAHPGAMTLLEVCQALEAKISRLRNRYYELAEIPLDDQLNHLKQVLENQAARIVCVTLSQNSPFKGCALKQIQLPQDVLVLCIIRNNCLIIARGDTRLLHQDTIFLMGSEPGIDKVVMLINPDGEAEVIPPFST